MINVTIPGKGELELKYAVFDVKGTLAVDGQFLPAVPELVDDLNDHLETLLGSDLVVPNIISALELLLKPTRLIASLRS